MTEFLISLFSISAVMAAVILLLCLLSKPLKKKISASTRYLLWAVIIVRLCIPVSLGLFPALITLPMPRAESAAETEAVTYETREPALTLDYAESAPQGSVAQHETQVPAEKETAQSPAVSPAVPETEPASAAETSLVIEASEQPEEKAVNTDMISLFIFIAWCGGTLISLAADLTKYYIYRRDINDSLYSADEDLLAAYRGLCADMGIMNYPSLFLSKKTESPMLIGYLSPCIVYPERLICESSARELIAHELTHYKRRDLWIKLLAVAARAIHWFNPAVHFAVARLEAEMELSCDEKTLKGKCSAERIAYGESMLQVVKNSSEKSAPLTTNFNPQKEAVKERLMNILDTTKKRKGIALIAIILVLSLISGSIIGCSVSSQSMGNGEETADIGESGKNGSVKFEDGEWQKLYGEYLMENQWAETSVLTYYPGEGLFYLDDVNGDGSPELIVGGAEGYATVILMENEGKVEAINFAFGGTSPWAFRADYLRYTEDGSRLCFNNPFGWTVFEKNDVESDVEYVLAHSVYEQDGKYYYKEVLKDKIFTGSDANYSGYRGETPVELTKEEFDAKLSELGLSDSNFKALSAKDMYVINPENIEAQLGYKASDSENAPEGAAFTYEELDALGEKHDAAAVTDEVKKFISGEDGIGKNLTLGDWYVSLEYEGSEALPTVYLTADVTESKLETVEAGVRIFKFKEGMMYVSVTDIATRPDYRCVNQDAGQLIRSFFGVIPYYYLDRAEDISDEDMSAYTTAIYDFVGGYFGAGRTKDEYMGYAEDIFGVRDEKVFSSIFAERDDGTYEKDYGHGGANVYYEFIASDNNSITVQFYADAGYFIKSDVIRYNFAGELNDLVLTSVETVYESENEPLCWMS